MTWTVKISRTDSAKNELTIPAISYRAGLHAVNSTPPAIEQAQTQAIAHAFMALIMDKAPSMRERSVTEQFPAVLIENFVKAANGFNEVQKAMASYSQRHGSETMPAELVEGAQTRMELVRRSAERLAQSLHERRIIGSKPLAVHPADINATHLANFAHAVHAIGQVIQKFKDEGADQPSPFKKGDQKIKMLDKNDGYAVHYAVQLDEAVKVASGYVGHRHKAAPALMRRAG